MRESHDGVPGHPAASREGTRRCLASLDRVADNRSPSHPHRRTTMSAKTWTLTDVAAGSTWNPGASARKMSADGPRTTKSPNARSAAD